jgi:hypothetical protein
MHVYSALSRGHSLRLAYLLVIIKVRHDGSKMRAKDIVRIYRARRLPEIWQSHWMVGFRTLLFIRGSDPFRKLIIFVRKGLLATFPHEFLDKTNDLQPYTVEYVQMRECAAGVFLMLPSFGLQDVRVVFG